MSGRLTGRTTAVLCALILSCVRASGADSIGVLHPICGFPYRYLLEITNYQGPRLERALQFKVLGESGLRLSANQWVDSPRPDDAKSSRIQIVHLARHWWRAMEMSGNFEIVFGDGTKLEGSFNAKYVKPPNPLICE